MSSLFVIIADLSSPYKKMFEETSVSFSRKPDHMEIKKDWYLSLINFLDRVFYQGRSDTVSGQFERATVKALDEFFMNPVNSDLRSLKGKGLLDWRKYGYNTTGQVEGKYCVELYNCLSKKYRVVNEERKVNTGTGKQRDRAMVVDTLRFISVLPDYNILEYSIGMIKDKKLRELDRELRKIRQIGEKTCSLFLRDTISFYGLDNYLEPRDYDILQPIDTWVHQMAKKLELIPKEMSLAKLQKKRSIITNAALDAGVSPIAFNQGLWYLPTHAVDLLFEQYKKQ